MGIHLTGSQILSAFARAPWAWSLEMPAISAALSELAKVVQYRNAGAHGAILGLVDAQKVTQHVRSLFASDLGLTLSAAKTGTRGY